MKIDRGLDYGFEENWSIHSFCNANQRAYVTAVFLHCEDKEKVFVRLLGAKSRLDAKKSINIPRLELLACVLGVLFTTFILEVLNVISIPVQYWAESSAVLDWIPRNDQRGTLVSSIVQAICKLS